MSNSSEKHIKEVRLYQLYASTLPPYSVIDTA